LEETAAKDAELGTKLKEMLSESEASIAKATENAMDNVRVVAEEVASSAAERLLGDAVDAGVVSAAVDTATKARN
jgi:F0F1-type ATP synthase membrane subunit b/b'